MPTGLAGGIERGLGGLAAGIQARKKSQAEEDAKALAARFLAQYQKSGGQMPEDNGGLSAFLGIPGALSFLNEPKQLQTKTADRGAMYQNAQGQWVPVDPNYEKSQASSPLAKLLQERDALPPGSPHLAAYDDAIKRASQGTSSYGVLVGPDYQYYGRDNHTGAVTGPLGLSHPPPVGGDAGDKARKDLEALREKKTAEAYQTGQALSTFDFQILANPGLVDQETKQWINPKTEEQFVTRRQSYIDKLNALQQELQDIEKQLGGTFKAQPIQNYKAAGLQITPIE